MKKLILSIIAILMGIILLAQGRVSTRKYRLADFPDKVTQVVLYGSELLQGALRQEVVDKWTASPFEFCTIDEFEERMTDDRYYFLIVTEDRFKDEEGPGLLFLSLLKGGKEAAQEGIDGLYEVITLPIQAAESGNGRELVFMGALVKAVQDFTLAAMESEKVAYQGADWFSSRFSRMGKMMQLVIAQEDLAPEVQIQDFERYLDDGNRLLPVEEADAEYLSGNPNTLVSFTVSPLIPSDGSYCYVLLVEAESEEIFYVARHKVNKGDGILPAELKKMLRRK